jgi:hypothetical protein
MNLEGISKAVSERIEFDVQILLTFKDPLFPFRYLFLPTHAASLDFNRVQKVLNLCTLRFPGHQIRWRCIGCRPKDFCNRISLHRVKKERDNHRGGLRRGMFWLCHQ